MNQHKTSLAGAEEWRLRRRFFPVPVPYRAKGPTIDGWQTLRLSAEELTRYFDSEPLNVGVLLGEPFGAADVDLDCPEARSAWAELGVETGLVFGHKSNPASHHFYRVDPPVKSVKYLDYKTTLLELRCLTREGKIGLQTVVPPSTHESGEAIRFERGCNREPANVDSSNLLRRVARTAAAALLARHWPPEKAGRHDAFLALAGVLARAKWSWWKLRPSIEQFIDAFGRKIRTLATPTRRWTQLFRDLTMVTLLRAGQS